VLQLRRFWGLIKRNPRSLTIAVVFVVLAVLGGGGAHLLEHYPANATQIDWITVLLYAMIFPTFMSSGFVAIVSFKWLTKQWETEKYDTLYAVPLDTPAQMAHKRHEVVTSCRKLANDIYCTSHCNLFHDPGVPKGPDGATSDKEEVIYQNRKFFRALAKLTIDSRQALKLLLFVPNQRAFEGELGERIDIYVDAGGTKDAVLDRSNFEPKQLIEESLTDFLVFEDHVFMTMRKSSKGKTEYVYIRSIAVAEHYRAWLKDLFDTGENSTPARVEEKEFRKKFEELVSNATGERKLASDVQSA
jgi:hypothetical protein